jgi:iron complex transport system permease protein
MSKYILIRSKKWPVSFLAVKKNIMVTIVLGIVSLLSMILTISIGDINLSPIVSLKAAFKQGLEEHILVIHSLRLPRGVVAFLAGACLAVAGAILQAVIRNPLASPDIIGITGGASVGAVFFITYLSGTVSISWLPVAAMLGAGIVSFLIYFLSWNKGVTPIRLVLVGIGIAALMNALTMLMIILSPIYVSGQAYVWLTGSVYGSSWENVTTILPWVWIFIPLLFVYSRHVNVQELGDEIATGVGSAVQRQRFILLLISVALTGAAVAVAGGIGFVGLIAPHIAKKLVGPSFGGLLPVSFLVGGLIVLLADLVARTGFSPLDVPVGVFTSAIGAPFFIYLLYTSQRR